MSCKVRDAQRSWHIGWTGEGMNIAQRSRSARAATHQRVLKSRLMRMTISGFWRSRMNRNATSAVDPNTRGIPSPSLQAAQL